MPTRPELIGDLGMVASTHWIASAVGMGVLERGGNAADAAVAAGFALQVVEPHLNGPGGDLPILLWDPAQAEVRVVCAQGVAPASATVEALRSRGVDVMPGTGLLAAVVPGAFGAGSPCSPVGAPGPWPTCWSRPSRWPSGDTRCCRQLRRRSTARRPGSAATGRPRPSAG